MSDGALLKVPAGAAAQAPVLIVAARTAASPTAVTLRNIVSLETGAQLTLIEAHVALAGASPAGYVNMATEVVLGDKGLADRIVNLL